MAQVDRGGTSTTPPSPPPVFRWRGGWVTERLYGINDVFRYEGASYITLLDHTSTEFFTDLATQKIELMADKGLTGEGTGDMLGANNLSEIVSPSTARSNIGAASTASLSSAVSALDSAKLNVSAKASTAEAEAGTDDAKYMTAVKTKEAILNIGLGVGQTWQNVSGSRAVNTTYTNTTGKPIMVCANSNSTALGSTIYAAVVDGLNLYRLAIYGNGAGYAAGVSFIVPAGSTYRVNASGTGGSALENWKELR